MKNKTNIQKIFNNIFKVQILLNITSCFCNIANGYIAGNFIDNIAVSCNSLIIPYNMAIASVAYIFSSSCEIICGKYLGVGDKKSLNMTFTLVIVMAIIASIAFTILSLLFPTSIITLLGANTEIISAATSYFYAYIIGIFAYILMPIFITFLNIENEGNYVTKSVILLAILYTIFGYLFVNTLKNSYFGLGLTNSLSKILILLFLFVKLYKNKNQIFFQKIEFDFSSIKRIFILGLPSGYSGVLLSIRNIVFNNILISNQGVIALSSYSIMLSSITIQDAIITSALNTAMITVSLCVGERNKVELLQLIRHIFTYVVPINAVLVIIEMLFSRQIANIYCSDINTLNLATNATRLYLLATIFEMCNDCLIAIYTTFEDFKFVNFFNIMHNIVLHVFFAFLTNRYYGSYAVFSSFIFAEIGSLFIYIIYSTIKNKHLPKTYYDLVVINNNFDDVIKHYISITNNNEITNISKNINEFCIKNNISKRKSFLTSLCAEEMIENIFDHGFTKKSIKDKKVDIYVIIDNDEISLRIRDNSVAFNPETRSVIFNPEDPCKNIGLRIVKNISKEMTYQNLFGLNNTIIKI